MTRLSALRLAAIGAAVCGMLIGEDARAQEVAEAPATSSPVASDSGAVTAYPPEFFAQFKPASANDMVQRLPGFTFDEGANVRGFAGSGGNVLIDGERPSSKSLGLNQLLQRIPASQVERIDLVRGGAPGIDMQGRPVVANVIRKKGAASTLAAQILFKPFPDGFVGVVPRLEGAWRSGPLSFEGQLGGRWDRTPSSGDGVFWRRTARGVDLFSGRFDADEKQDQIQFNATGEYRPGVDVLRINLSAAREEVTRVELSELRDGAGAFTTRLDSVETDHDYEFGGDYQRPLTATTEVQIIALATIGKETTVAVNRSRGPTQENDGESDGGERIVRAVFTSTPNPALRLEGGGEGAFNFLDSRQSLRVGGVRVPLPSDTVRVEERRGEVFGTAVWKATEQLSIEGGLRYERSTISQTGGAQQERTLSFAKPRLIVSWAPDDASQVRLRIERVVGQLNFNDFTASAQLDTGQHNAGNPNLQPERSWTIETAFERRFWSAGAAVVTLTHEEVESVVDLIPIDNRYDAPGNIGDGWRQSVRVNLNLPFDRLGFGGALLKLNTVWRRSEVTDPVTGRVREVSYQNPFEGDATFTQTITSLNSVFAIQANSLSWRDSAYRINEIRYRSETPFINVYWDWTPRSDLLLRFQVENALSKGFVRKRTLYDGPRSLGLINAYEKREQQLDPFLMVRIRKIF